MTTPAGAVPQADHIHLELDPAVVIRGYARHRRRFAASAGTLTAGDLAAPSRCSEWTVADVLRHGGDADDWMRTIWAGEVPFAAFDPRVTPHESVLQGRSCSDAEARDRYIDSAEQMASDVEGSGPERWGLPSLSPVGRVPWWFSLLHVLYDSWVHERDVLLPLGRDVPVEADEVDAVLAYSLALVPIVSRVTGNAGPLDAVVCGFRVTAGEGPVTVAPAASERRNGVPVLTGDAPVVVDGLSGRGSLDGVLAGDPDVTHRLGELARFFTTPV